MCVERHSVSVTLTPNIALRAVLSLKIITARFIFGVEFENIVIHLVIL